MKNQIIKAIIAAAILGTSQLALASIQDLQGTWVVSDRICTDGSQAQDAYKPGRDSVVLTISGGQFQTVTKINGKTYTSSGTLLVSDHQLVFTDANGSANSELYEVGKANELVLFNAEFGKGGSCAEGEGLMIVLQKR